MEASSREALVEVRERLAEITQPAGGVLAKARDAVTRTPRAATGPELLQLADELFAVGRLLDGTPTLRRALSDPAGKPDERAALVRRLLSAKVSAATLDLLETIARQRWSRPLDLVEATTALAVEASLDAAEARAELESVEDELFRFGRIVSGDQDLARILGDASAPVEGKAALLDRLLAGRVSPVTEQLLRNVLTSRHVGNAGAVVEELSEAANRRRGRSTAHVTTAVPLTAAQELRLTESLGRLYGRTIGLQVTVDPDVVGGLVVQVGDEVIDGSIAQRLEAARRRLAG
ncbi:F0F1 ATP synthase subunit delta [Blastococcus sp. TF02A-30]|uniref:F0F1 ATP synthase subunit delta n=1 Tax=Blastococcus sp. TF02A-30 TaxID=2250580 RepID=UPI000DEB9942|nr:F0F1 ATP synthase subunit delta [Blastococcus sp. TF02A-30]RBY86416.1 F0F1 ATP synthase subunit delta [Blastococcus sp. TF02A-30]